MAKSYFKAKVEINYFWQLSVLSLLYCTQVWKLKLWLCYLPLYKYCYIYHLSYWIIFFKWISSLCVLNITPVQRMLLNWKSFFFIVAHKTWEVIDLTPLQIVRCSSLGVISDVLWVCWILTGRLQYHKFPTVIHVGRLWMNGHWNSATFGERRVVLSDLIWDMENCCLFLVCS